MHIVHLYDGHERVYQGRGSVPNVVWNVARETVDAGHDVTVVERQWAGLEPTTVHEGVRFERLNLRTGADEPWTRVPYREVKSPVRLARMIGDRANFARAARRQLANLDVDILHVHLPFAANVLLSVARSYRRKTVFTAHLGELRLNLIDADSAVDIPRVLSLVSPDVYLAKRVARTTVLNADIETAFREHGVPADRLSVLPNGVDIARFEEVDDAEAEGARDAYWETSRPALLFVGTVMPRKGVDDLVRAVGMLDSGYDREVELVIAGEDELDGEYVAEIRALVRERGLAERVRLIGFVPDEELPALYAAADVFVSPAREEGFGMTVAEATAAGTAVVATSVGGVGQLLDDGRCGRLLEADNPTGLAAALDDLLSDEGQRERLVEAARDHVRKFAWPAVTEQFLDVYASIAGEAEQPVG